MSGNGPSDAPLLAFPEPEHAQGPLSSPLSQVASTARYTTSADPQRRDALSEPPSPITKGDGDHWKKSRQLLDKYDDKILDGWKDEINTQLLVASLLAAVTATFIIEAQKDLAEDPAMTSTLLLSIIAMQINGSINLPSSSIEPFSGPSPISRAINSLFYVSLALSLANVTLGLLSLQWIRDLKFEPPGILNKDYLHFRWVRHYGFRRWGGKTLIVALPLILLFSLGTFFAGLLIYVSDMDWVVASPLYAVLTTVFLIIAFTTFVPGIVVVLHTTFHRAGGKKPFTSMPPFRSLQSWIALQFVIGIFRSFNFIAGVRSFDSFRSLKHCPDWGRVDQLWTRWFSDLEKTSIITPLELSTNDPKNVDNVVLCYGEIDPPKFQSSHEATRLWVLRKFVAFGEMLPPYTLGQVANQLIDHLVLMVHHRRPIEDFGALSTEDGMGKLLIEVESLDSVVRLLDASIEICKLRVPSDDMGPFNLFWYTLRRAMVDFEGALRPSAPEMIKRHFDTYLDIIEKKPEVAAVTPNLQGFRDFVAQFALEIRMYPYWRSTPHGAGIGRAILYHPLWQQLHERVDEDFPNPPRDIHILRDRMAELETFKAEIPAQNTQMEKAGGTGELSISRSTSAAPPPSGTGRMGAGSLSTALSIHTQVTRHSSLHGTHGTHSQAPSPRTPGSAGPQQQHQRGSGSRPWERGPAVEAQLEGGTPPSFPRVTLPPRSPTSPMLASSPFRAPPSLTTSGPSPMRMPSISVALPTLDSQAQGPQTGDASTFNPKDGEEDPGKGSKEPDSAVQFGETPMQPSPPAWGITPVVEEDQVGGAAMKREGGVTSLDSTG